MQNQSLDTARGEHRWVRKIYVQATRAKGKPLRRSVLKKTRTRSVSWVCNPDNVRLSIVQAMILVFIPTTRISRGLVDVLPII